MCVCVYSYCCCTGGAFRTLGRLPESYSEVAIQITLDRTVPSRLLLDTPVPSSLLKNTLASFKTITSWPNLKRLTKQPPRYRTCKTWSQSHFQFLHLIERIEQGVGLLSLRTLVEASINRSIISVSQFDTEICLLDGIFTEMDLPDALE